MINYEDFKNVEMRIGRIVEAEKVEKSDKLLKLLVDFGDEKRTIVSGIAEVYTPEDLIEKQVPFVTNLEPRTIFGIESNGMILASHDKDDKPVLLFPDKEVPDGSDIS